jgi:alanyl-tRNA synthetase
MALFGEKYDEKVRVVSMGPFSIELSGGTHVNATGDIGLFVIASESGIASGIRRIEAITGPAAVAYMQAASAQLKLSASLLKTDTDSVAEKIEALQAQQKNAEKALAKLKDQAASQQGADLLSGKTNINGIDVLVAKLDGVEAKALRPMVDDLKNRLGSGVIMLGVAQESKVSLISGVTKDLTGKVKAGELVNFVAAQVGGKGGGRPDMAQAGGDQPDNLDAALNSVNAWLKDKL